MPDVVPTDQLDRTAVALASALRERGVPVPTGATVAYARALALAGGTPAGAYWAGRATLVVRPEHVAAYDQAFGAVMGGLRSAEVQVVPRPVEVRLDADDPDAPDPAAPGEDPAGEESARSAGAPPSCCATATSRPALPTSWPRRTG